MAELVKIDELKNEQIAAICDHTFLETVEGYKYKVKDCDPIAKRTRDFNDFLEKSVYGPFKFAAICVRGSDTAYARQFIDDRKSKLILAVTTGFPDGRVPLNQKVYETRAALENGADEIDFVINWDRLSLGGRDYVEKEMKTIARLTRSHKKKSKAILETAMLNDAAIVDACECAEDAGIDFVKTSTGYTGGATPEAVKLMRQYFRAGVKASGGVKQENVRVILQALSGRSDGLIDLNPQTMRIGEGSLFKGIDRY